MLQDSEGGGGMTEDLIWDQIHQVGSPRRGIWGAMSCGLPGAPSSLVIQGQHFSGNWDLNGKLQGRCAPLCPRTPHLPRTLPGLGHQVQEQLWKDKVGEGWAPRMCGQEMRAGAGLAPRGSGQWWDMVFPCLPLFLQPTNHLFHSSNGKS